MRFGFLFSLILSFLCSGVMAASEPVPNDSTRQLETLVVTASRQPSEVIPAQTLSGDELNRLNSNSVADALRYFSGV